MVFIVDEGSEFDVPFAELWNYLPSDKHKHPAKIISREISGNVLTLTTERDIGGKMTKVTLRITMYPPLGVTQEYLEGPAEGSKVFLYYYPLGSDKTGITVVGDFKIAGAEDEASTKRAVAQMLERSFNEDVAILKQLSK